MINEWTDRGEYLTPQEHCYIGSSVEQNNSKNYPKLYIPLAVQKGEDISAIIARREQEKTFMTGFYLWVDQDGNQCENSVKCFLSPLNLKTGETLNDPKPLDERLRPNPKFIKTLKLRH
ncbi:TPA: hypothetical protein HA246_05985 [Candidatus Woesearchaeota archaeon]|nr:hypothetical protein [Candidatus Woesearchaeota archaeon]